MIIATSFAFVADVVIAVIAENKCCSSRPPDAFKRPVPSKSKERKNREPSNQYRNDTPGLKRHGHFADNDGK